MVHTLGSIGHSVETMQIHEHFLQDALLKCPFSLVSFFYFHSLTQVRFQPDNMLYKMHYKGENKQPTCVVTGEGRRKSSSFAIQNNCFGHQEKKPNLLEG